MKLISPAMFMAFEINYYISMDSHSIVLFLWNFYYSSHFCHFLCLTHFYLIKFTTVFEWQTAKGAQQISLGNHYDYTQYDQSKSIICIII